MEAATRDCSLPGSDAWRASCSAPQRCFCRLGFPPKGPRQTRKFPPISPRRMSCRAFRHRAAISPRATPACSATPAPLPPITARRSGATRRIPSCWSARSCRCWRKATSRRRSGLPTRSSSSTRTTGSPGWCSACTRSSRRNTRWRPESRAVRARPDHRSRRHAARRLGELRRGRCQGRHRVDRQAAGRRLVRAVQGSARRPDPRSRRQQEGSRQALRARLQARRHRAARGRGLRLVAVAQRQKGRGAEGVQGLRRPIAAPSADRRGDGRAQERQAAAAAGRRPRRPAPPKCSTGSAPRSAAAAARISGSSICSLRSISRPTIRWRCCRSPISTSR